ncbi:hypothetical protein F5Y19DRAFT_226491 [Xylariaceae sp. FL1651]|nr:hypothetical protein F5Y19DRAFT_226491 [Xylariaceae sp. FL1651]
MAITLLTPTFWIPFLLMATTTHAAHQVSQLFQFTYGTSVENLLPLSNGCLLLSTIGSGSLYYINPEALYPSAQNVITLPGSTALTGMAALGNGLYAVSGGVQSSPSCFVEGSMQVYVVSVAADSADTKLVHGVSVPDTCMMDGMAALPKHPRTVLSADSIGGRILRIDTLNDCVSVAFSDAALGPGNNATALGIKGLRIRGDYLYFTNSAQGIFGRFPIDENGTNTGKVEILAHPGCRSDEGNSYDDFAFDDEGNVFVAVHPSSINKITPGGAESTFAGDESSETFLEPTSVVISNDKKSLYVSTGGKDTGFPISGGQVVKVQLK